MGRLGHTDPTKFLISLPLCFSSLYFFDRFFAFRIGLQLFRFDHRFSFSSRMSDDSNSNKTTPKEKEQSHGKPSERMSDDSNSTKMTPEEKEQSHSKPSERKRRLSKYGFEKTPPRYWDIDFPSKEEQEALGLVVTLNYLLKFSDCF
jgi:hypothetical protein